MKKNFIKTTKELAELPADIDDLAEISVVTQKPLNRALLEEAVRSDSSGACITFAGVVRNHDPAASGTVSLLEYSAHPDATAYLRLIVSETNRVYAHPDDEIAYPIRVAAAHRIGSLNIGDEALLVVVASAHRTEAFKTCTEVVERIKAEVPIWKKQATSTGDIHWVGV